MSKIYDSIVIGAGASGITTAIYNSRAGLSVALVESGLYGGVINDTEKVDNYTGFTSVSGEDLAYEMENHAREQQNIEHIYGKVENVSGKAGMFNVLVGKKEIFGKSIVIATGVKHKKIGINGEDEYQGKAISNCVVCDINFFKDGEVVMIGGGNSSVEGAIYASKVVDKVTLVHRRDELRADKVNQDMLFGKNNIDVIWNADTTEFIGDNLKANGIKYIDKITKEEKVISADGFFVNVGVEPVTDVFKGLSILDSEGYVVTNDSMETSQLGIFAVGDVRSNSIRQVVTAVGDGAIASDSIIKFIRNI